MSLVQVRDNEQGKGILNLSVGMKGNSKASTNGTRGVTDWFDAHENHMNHVAMAFTVAASKPGRAPTGDSGVTC